MISSDLTTDLLFSGRLSVEQPGRGHRVGTDAVLLAASTPPGAMRIADLGAGTGTVGLRAAQMNIDARVSLFEREAPLLELAKRNIITNGLSERVDITSADIFLAGSNLAYREAFDCVLTNPPFRNAGRARPSLNSLKSSAHVMQASPRAGESGLEGWVRNAASILAPSGEIVMIHMAEALEEILGAFSRRFGDLRLRFIHPHAASAANRLMIAGRKGSRAPLRVLDPLVLHQENGDFLPEAAALHAGAARLILGNG